MKHWACYSRKNEFVVFFGTFEGAQKCAVNRFGDEVRTVRLATDDEIRRAKETYCEEDLLDKHTCGDCGKELQIVRPGKYQCVNPKCGTNHVMAR